MSRICKNCGAPLEEDSLFCGVCGKKLEQEDSEKVKKCIVCGTILPDNAVFCSECGAVQTGGNEINDKPAQSSEAAQTNSAYGNAAGYGTYNSSVQKKRGINPIALGAAIGGAVVLIGAVVFAVLIIGGRSDTTDKTAVNETEEPISVSVVSQTSQADAQITPSLAPTPTPVPQTPPPTPIPPTSPPAAPQANVPAASSSSAAYQTYSDSVYSFSCAYPSDFRLTVVESDFYRYTVSSPDGMGSIYICATSNNNGRTPARVIDNFLSSYGGATDYKNSGSDWCAIRTLENSRYHYGYFKLTGGYIRGFEAHFPASQFDKYDKYINDIYGSIKFY